MEDAVEKKVDHSVKQGIAVLGIGLIAMGEDISMQMCTRIFGHLVTLLFLIM